MTQVDKKAKKSNSGGQGASAKNASGKSDAPPASAARDSEELSESSSAVKASANKTAHAGAAHAGAAKGHHDHSAQIREYFVIFGVLFVLTVLEVAVAQIPGIGKTALTVALIGLALTKAAIVGLFYMHLKHETRILRLTVALPMVFPAIYAVVLIGEAAWRLTR
jgi:cytochrome c oxidase subunit IV